MILVYGWFLCFYMNVSQGHEYWVIWQKFGKIRRNSKRNLNILMFSFLFPLVHYLDFTYSLIYRYFLLIIWREQMSLKHFRVLFAGFISFQPSRNAHSFLGCWENIKLTSIWSLRWISNLINDCMRGEAKEPGPTEYYSNQTFPEYAEYILIRTVQGYGASL